MTFQRAFPLPYRFRYRRDAISCSGYRGVRERSNGTFYAEIRAGDERIGLGMFETAHEARATPWVGGSGARGSL
jgi:hypothetical protein